MMAAKYSDDPEKLLPEAGALESARAYREKKAKPLLAGIVKVLRSVYHAYLDLVSKFERLQSSYAREVSKNNTLSDRLKEVISENRSLRNVAENYERVSPRLWSRACSGYYGSGQTAGAGRKEQKRVVKQRHDRV